MQLYYDGSGNLLQAIPEEVYQGSANANTVYFIGAFPNNCVVAIAYRLPNGDITEQQLLSLVTETELTNVQTPSGQSFNVWKRTLDKIVTENCGTATIQFFVYDGAANANAQANALATQTYSFNVLKGVPYLLPDELSTGSDLLTEILDALSAFGDVYEYRTEAVNAATQAQASATAASESATQAASSATAAAQSATNAQTAETNATQSATQAQDSATSALNSANAAALSASQAQNAATQNAKDIDNIYTILGATVTDKYPLSQAYSSRETADGNADIIDGALTRVKKIQGATVAVNGTLKNAYFKGIKSTGRNLINPANYKFLSKTSGGVDFTVQSDGGIKAKGTSTGVITLEFIQIKSLYGATPLFTDYGSGAQVGKYALSGAKNDVNLGANPNTGSLYFYITGAGKVIDTVIYPMIQYGKPAEVDLTYEPYKADESFMLDNAEELKQFDYIDTQSEKIVKQTELLTLTGAESWVRKASSTSEVLVAYANNIPNAVNFNDIEKPKAVCFKDGFVFNYQYSNDGIYKVEAFSLAGSTDCLYMSIFTSRLIALGFTADLAGFKEYLQHEYDNGTPYQFAYVGKRKQTNNIEIPTNKYQAFNGGSETQVQGDTADTDNSADGANCEITQDYYTQKGA